MVLALLPPYTGGQAAAQRIEITSLYTKTNYNADPPEPLIDSEVPRFTQGLITVTATIENISDSQIGDLYYVVTNMNTGIEVIEKSNKAAKSGQFDIQFSNVQLTEGLNRIIIKLGDQNVISSPPGWVYFTPTTTISNLQINQTPFENNKIYPENPALGTALNITGDAPNATEVQAVLFGDPQPKNAYFSNGSFFFIADDINQQNVQSNFQLSPGDNFLTIIAKNASKYYQVERRLIYDNGGPFAFQGQISHQDTADENGNGVTTETLTKDLLFQSVVSDPEIKISSKLKVDYAPSGDLQYRYVDVFINGQKYGPYDLTTASPAPTITGIQPNTLENGYSETHLSLAGTGLLDAARVTVDIEGADGSMVATNLPALKAEGDLAVIKLDDALLTKANSSYKFIVKYNGSIIGQSTLQVASNSGLPLVLDGTSQDGTLAGVQFATPLNEGYAANTTNIVRFNAAISDSAVRIDVLDKFGRNVLGTVSAPADDGAADTATFALPTGLPEGSYKLHVSYNAEALAERFFTIGPPQAKKPSYSQFYPSQLIEGYSDTYLTVRGSDLGIDESKFTAQITNGTATVNLETVYAENGILTFKLPAGGGTTGITALTQGTYDLTINESITNSTKIFAGGITVNTPSNYNGETITSVSPLQVMDSLISTTDITVTGTKLTNKDLVTADLYNEADDTFVASVYAMSADGTKVVLDLPFVPAGNYKLKLAYNGNELAQYPFTVVNPTLVSNSPSAKNVDATTPNTMTIRGTDMGRDPSKLKLRFEDALGGSTPVDVNQAISVDAGTKAVFNLPDLPEGNYNVRMFYEGIEANNVLKYNVLSPGATIAENAQWSKPGRYKVFDFNVNLTIPSERNQMVDFRFYNDTTDNVPPTSYIFSYVNPNLPYVDYVEKQIGSSYVRLTDGMEISELPVTFRVAANAKTTKVNLYTGDVTNDSVPYLSVNTFTTMNGKNYFTFRLEDLPEGDVKLAFIPSNNTTINSKQGENPAGQQVRNVRLITTPYVILQNVYNGMVIRNSSEIQPITGRVVNVPSTEWDDIVVTFNNDNTNMTVGDGKDFQTTTDPSFSFGFGTGDRSNIRLIEGKNLITFSIYKQGILVTQATYEVFLFSTDAPEFVSVVPVDGTKDPKFIEADREGTYVTRENYVQFQGQFANATEIKLTVRTKDANGNPVVRYDRRYNNFTQRDPLNNNPNYFNRINSPINQFLTNTIKLADDGPTIFEFTISNSSNIVVTKTIEIVREPLPYEFIYPKLTNGKAVINSNFIELEMIAEGADAVFFKKDAAIKREVTTYDGRKEDRFYYELRDLKPGTNRIKFTVVRGTEELDGEIELYNADTPIIGAMYKTELKTNIRVFDKLIQLKFPRDTVFKRNDNSAVNPFLSADRQILFGIADPYDGRVDKYRHPSARDGQIGNPNPLIDSNARFLLTEPTGRFRLASQMFWIDAGTIAENETDGYEIMNGSGRLPYDSAQFYRRSYEDLVVPSQRGTLTLTYDQAIRNEGWKYLTVYHFDYYEDYKGEKQWRWRNLGGVVDPKKGTITVPFERFGYYQVMYMARSYDDVINHPWARNDLDIMYSKGLMVNKETTSFVPNDAITRAEFTTMLVKIFEIPLNYEGMGTFTDVRRINPLSNGLYDYKYIETAARAGIVRGEGGGRFYPDSAITRQDAAVMISRAANLKLVTDEEKVLKSLQKLFTDANQTDIYARPSVLAVTKAELIEGKQNILLQGQRKPTFRFDPLENFTRAEAARVAIRVLAQQKKIPKQ